MSHMDVFSSAQIVFSRVSAWRALFSLPKEEFDGDGNLWQLMQMEKNA